MIGQSLKEEQVCSGFRERGADVHFSLTFGYLEEIAEERIFDEVEFWWKLTSREGIGMTPIQWVATMGRQQS